MTARERSCARVWLLLGIIVIANSSVGLVSPATWLARLLHAVLIACWAVIVATECRRLRVDRDARAAS